MKHLLPLRWTGLVFLASALSLHAADRSSLWTGLGDGSTWEAPDNWSHTPTLSTPAFPNNTGSDNFFTTIHHATGALTITTSQAIELRGLSLTQQAGGSTTLKLGGDMALITGLSSTKSGFYNQTGNKAGIILDLNGHQFSATGVTAARQEFDTGQYTLKSSASNGAGTFVVRAIGSTATLDVQNNVTVRLAVSASSYLSRATWSSGSTLQIANVGAHQGYLGDGATSVSLGNLVIGDRTNTGDTNFLLNSGAFTVLGDVKILSFTGATGGAASRISFAASTHTLKVGGNLTDEATDATSYSNAAGTTTGTIAFIGGSAQKSVSIGRTALKNHFAIGATEGSGNIALAKNLATTGNVTLQGDSRLNLSNFTLSSGNFTAADGASFAFERNGTLNISGTLTLGSFDLELLGDWSDWTSGDNLTLFSYGTLDGAPDIANFINTAGLQYDSLVAEDGLVYLTNVTVIPEPGVYSLLIISALVATGMARSRFKTAA